MADVQDPNSHAYPNEGALIIPVTRADLGRFIGGLLGQPQTIEDSFSGPFDLQKHDLVDQRIRQQNRGELIQFTVRVVYDDDSTILLNGLEDFRHYHEVRPRISVEAHLSWTYLIQFEDKQTPEKQNIEVIISTKAVIRDIPRNFILKIQHTGRTWGFDIEHLLSGQIKSWIYHEHAFKQLIYRYRGRIGLTFAILFMILIGTYLDFIETDFQNMQRMAAAGGVLGTGATSVIPQITSINRMSYTGRHSGREGRNPGHRDVSGRSSMALDSVQSMYGMTRQGYVNSASS